MTGKVASGSASLPARSFCDTGLREAGAELAGADGLDEAEPTADGLTLGDTDGAADCEVSQDPWAEPKIPTALPQMLIGACTGAST